MILDDRPPPLHLVQEVARLAALRSYHVLDIPDVPGVESLVRAAALCMGRPLAALSLVDSDRLWFGATQGIDWHETPRAGSYCDHAIEQSAPLVVSDGLADPRFCDHPYVQGEAGFRFYAGACLEDEDGYRLGTLCVFDHVPGAADPGALIELARLATMATGALAAHRGSLSRLLAAAQPLQPGRVQGWLGVRTRGSSQREAGRPGLIVLSVAADSPAKRAGLRPTDILAAIDGRVLRRSADVVAALANRLPEGLARLQILRNGQSHELTVAIEPEPGTRAPARPTPDQRVAADGGS
ncbi:MAG: hypothetical protein NVSMB18_25800 [Acetobacteraceae bacterium]